VWNNVAVWADTDHESMSVHTRGEKTVGQYGGDISQNRGRVMRVSCRQRGQRLATGQETGTERIVETVVSGHEQSTSGAASPQEVRV